MKLIIEAISDKGVVRTANEDLILVGNDTLRDAAKRYEFDFSTYEHPFIIAVADGLGGHKAGAAASEYVLHNMAKAVNQLPPNLARTIVKSYFTATSKTIHDCILDEGIADSSKKGMASTFSGILFYGTKVFLLHVGDSRIYHYIRSKNELIRLSRDHSLQELDGDDGALKTAIVNAFGADKDIFIDFNEITSKLQDSDLLLICSDGLTKELTDEQIANSIGNSNSYLTLAEEAKKSGGNDNISLAVIRYMKYW
jgi:protein phosphatase